MADPERTQKEISTRYHGRIDYRGRLHGWRAARIVVTGLTIIGGIGAAVWYHKHGREEFFNAGTISRPHQKFASDCAQCHDKAAARELDAAKASAVVAQRFHSGVEFAAIDRKCAECHIQHELHEPNVVDNRSCSACHQEHRGLDSLRRVANSQCASCHNNDAVMQASADKGMRLPPIAFDIHPHRPPQNVFQLPRPARGYTAVFEGFAEKHPEFQLVREHARDPDVLKFNHQRHLTGSDIPQVNGRKLDCAFCHAPDVEGRFYQRISFEANCKVCHSLQFDLRNPELQLPHGDAAAVRGFLHALPTRYAELAAQKGIRDPNAASAFVAAQINQLRMQVQSGEELERHIFFTANPYKPQRDVAGTRASFYGCALCHEVKAAGAQVPVVTKPMFVDRWMTRSDFNHAKHTSVRCDDCHHATQSRETSDVLMPGKASCTNCHSPRGKTSSDCILCHRYHAPLQSAALSGAVPPPPITR